MVMATSTVVMLAPVTETRAIASRMPGIAMMASIVRMMNPSSVRNQPAITPMTSPMATLTTAAPRPAISEMRAP
ncbi:hypothetical protein G6F23_015720 [Rhizopus arrhizus]|nr:hypothetical protein G6F23_015720 [Rhizopus arrhizus]